MMGINESVFGKSTNGIITDGAIGEIGGVGTGTRASAGSMVSGLDGLVALKSIGA